VADVITTGPGLAGRERVRAEDDTGTEYRTFPARLPALLSVVAGSFGFLGALGTGVRASAITDLHEDPKQVGVVMGYRSGAGWLLAVLAIVVMLSAFAWLGRRGMLRSAAAGVAITFAVLAVLRLTSFDRRASELAEKARQNPDFIGFHAGLGWGGWLLLVGAILTAFALLVGLLRQLDLRKGIAE